MYAHGVPPVIKPDGPEVSRLFDFKVQRNPAAAAQLLKIDDVRKLRPKVAN